MKNGANVSDINQINALAAGGKTSEEISNILLIEEAVVVGFMPKKAKAKAKAKGNDK